MNKKVLTLISRLEKELVELKQVVYRVAEAWERALTKEDDYYIDAVALNLQSFYTGLERIFTAIASQIDENVPSGNEWHKDILRQMSTEIKLIRPQIISQELVNQLDNYRGFRHIVRNLYAFNFSKANIEKLVLALPKTYNDLQNEINTFLEYLEEQALKK